jgi:mannose-6-phosphate isomerase
LQEFCRKPWGEFHVLTDSPYTKVKRLIINPGHRLSLQSHKLREEHWVVVRGQASVTIGDQEKEIGYGQYVFVPKGTKHRIACQGNEPVEIIEVQTGEAFPEEDIIRFEDDYQRT